MKNGKSGRKKGQEHKEGRARNGGRQDKPTMKKGQAGRERANKEDKWKGK